MPRWASVSSQTGTLRAEPASTRAGWGAAIRYPEVTERSPRSNRSTRCTSAASLTTPSRDPLRDPSPRVPTSAPARWLSRLCQEPVEDRLRGRAIGLVDDQQVGDFQDSGLERLDGIPQPRGHDHHDRVGRAHDVELALADADRFEDEDAEPGRVEHVRGIAGGRREAAEVVARRHAADVHAGVAAVPEHADAVAQDRPAAVGAGGVDGHDGHRGAVGPRHRDQVVDEGALAHPRRPGDADPAGAAGPGPHRAHDLRGGRGIVLHRRQQPAEPAPGPGLRGRRLTGRARRDHPGPPGAARTLSSYRRRLSTTRRALNSVRGSVPGASSRTTGRIPMTERRCAAIRSRRASRVSGAVSARRATSWPYSTLTTSSSTARSRLMTSRNSPPKPAIVRRTSSTALG